MPTGKEFFNDRTGSRKGYTGHLKDSGSDLVYMKARFYDPVIGRFYSNDPVGFTASNPMMFNRYAYANNNPFNYIDPDGRNATEGIGRFFSEVWEGVTGSGDGEFNGSDVAESFANGYNGTLEESLKAAGEDLLLVAGGGVGGKLAYKVAGWVSGKAKKSYEIVDGVRRAKAAQLNGNKKINAQILDEKDRLVGQGDLPIDSLRSPKSSINLTNSQVNMDRFMDTLDRTKAGSRPPHITVTRGNRGTNIKDVGFD